MKFPIYQIDSFTDKILSGNPSAVIPLQEWLSDDLMQRIAAENNLAETAFFVPTDTGYHIRWFTPTVEVELCGHATLAAAYALFFIHQIEGDSITFDSQSGSLVVKREDDMLTLDFPIDQYQVSVPPPALTEALSPIIPLEVYKGKTDFMVVLDSEAEIRDLQLDIIILSTIPARGVIFTARGTEVDFVSRFFAPQSGVDEDPVTGSAHTTLAPYWARKLEKIRMTARQLSPRGGELICEIRNERVLISGRSRLYLKGEIELDI
jgi:PhzF family phenazine biosynthesis protein